MPIRRLFDQCCRACVEALYQIYLAGTTIVAIVMIDSRYTQAEADCNAAAANVGRPAATNEEMLKDRTRLWKVR